MQISELARLPQTETARRRLSLITAGISLFETMRSGFSGLEKTFTKQLEYKKNTTTPETNELATLKLLTAAKNRSKEAHTDSAISTLLPVAQSPPSNGKPPSHRTTHSPNNLAKNFCVLPPVLLKYYLKFLYFLESDKYLFFRITSA